MAWVNTYLTGNTRYRSNLFGKLIVQVEEVSHFKNDVSDPYGNTDHPYDGTGRLKWRDAKINDLKGPTV